MQSRNKNTTVDGGNPANQLRLVVYPIIYNALYIPDGAEFQHVFIINVFFLVDKSWLQNNDSGCGAPASQCGHHFLKVGTRIPWFKKQESSLS